MSSLARVCSSLGDMDSLVIGVGVGGVAIGILLGTVSMALLCVRRPRRVHVQSRAAQRSRITPDGSVSSEAPLGPSETSVGPPEVSNGQRSSADQLTRGESSNGPQPPTAAQRKRRVSRRGYSIRTLVPRPSEVGSPLVKMGQRARAPLPPAFIGLPDELHKVLGQPPRLT